MARLAAASRADLERDIAAAQGVVNATQIGMRGFPGNPVPTFALKASHWAADVIYTPIETEFIKAAAAKGARVLNGGGNVRAPGGRGIPAVYRYRARRRSHASRVRHGACRAGPTEVRSDLTRSPGALENVAAILAASLTFARPLDPFSAAEIL